jgi:phosphatidylserine/phosphatidylglycerophosphate/cardiolipin synthase-like enzyme
LEHNIEILHINNSLMMALVRLNSERGSSREDNSGLLRHCLSAGELTNLPALFTCHPGCCANRPTRSAGISLSILVRIVVSLAILDLGTSILEQVGQHAIAHNKIIIIDGATVVTGSFNFTQATDEGNAENLLVIHDARIATKYEENWQAHFPHSEDYAGSTVPLAWYDRPGRLSPQR